MNFTIASTTGPGRTGTLTIAGKTFSVTQASGCTFSINPTTLDFVSGGGPSGNITVTTAAGCTWTSTTTDGFITINTGATGTGPGTVTFTVAANLGGARTGHLTIAGVTFTVTQQKH